MGWQMEGDNSALFARRRSILLRLALAERGLLLGARRALAHLRSAQPWRNRSAMHSCAIDCRYWSLKCAHCQLCRHMSVLYTRVAFPRCFLPRYLLIMSNHQYTGRPCWCAAPAAWTARACPAPSPGAGPPRPRACVPPRTGSPPARPRPAAPPAPSARAHPPARTWARKGPSRVITKDQSTQALQVSL